MKKIINFVFISIIVFFVGYMFSKSSIQIVPDIQATDCKSLNSECKVNSSDKECCGSLICQPFNSHSENGKCKAAPTSIPTSVPTTRPTSIPTSIPTSVPTSIPTSIPTATPTITPQDSPTPTQTITPQDSPTPQPTNPPSSDNPGQTSTNNPGAPVCNDQKPGTPSNLQARFINNNQVLLTWDHASGSHTSYLIAYGPNSSNFQWGNPNVGNNNSYTVSSLTSGAQYCFYVAAQNGCTGGDKSNIVCINQIATRLNPNIPAVLGATDNYNPLVEGIAESYGGSVLGISTELMSTAEVVYSNDKLPSGNSITADSISIPSLNINQPIYLPQEIGDILTVGQREVLSTNLHNTQIYYGHNGTDIFGSLYKIELGSQVNIVKNNLSLNYQVVSKEFVSKYAIDSIAVKDSADIVLVTCSYTQPDYRILVKASLIK